MRTTITNRMMIGASLLMMTFSFATKTNAETCTQVPTCAELGFTETNCGSKKALKCPFDQTKLFCVNTTPCMVGDIYYSDNNCRADYDTLSNVTALGVVAGDGIILWSDIPANTATWVDARDSCKQLIKGGKTAHLPTIDEGLKIAKNYNAINAGLQKISGGVTLYNQYYWSSTVPDHATYAQGFNPSSGDTDGIQRNDVSAVRCVFDF